MDKRTDLTKIKLVTTGNRIPAHRIPIEFPIGDPRRDNRADSAMRMPLSTAYTGANTGGQRPVFDLDSSPTEHIWDPQPDEPALWYDRFTRYMLLPMGRRNVRQAAMDEKGGKFLSAPPTMWNRTSEMWRWKERAAAHDIWMAEQDRIEFEVARKENRKRRIQVALKLTDRVEEALPNINFSKLNGKDFAEVVRIVFNELRTDFNDMPTQRLAMIRIQAAREVAEELGIDVSEVLDSFDDDGLANRPGSREPKGTKFSYIEEEKEPLEAEVVYDSNSGKGNNSSSSNTGDGK